MRSYCQWSLERYQTGGRVTLPGCILKIFNYRQKLEKKLYHEHQCMRDLGSQLTSCGVCFITCVCVSVYASSSLITSSSFLRHFRVVNCGCQATSSLKHFHVHIIPWSSGSSGSILFRSIRSWFFL